MPRNGYLYIWVSNETQGWDVFFDNLSVQYKQGPILEENHYYPFGLTMAGISDKALKTNYAENKYRFQKQELQNKEFSDGSGLELYEFKYRMDDPQIGRFWSIDPLASKYEYNSPYAFSEDKVTGHIELEGLEAVDINKSNNPYVRAAADANVQKAVASTVNNASGAVKVTVSVGPGVGVEGKVGNTGVKVEAKGPQASVSVNAGGSVSAEGSAGSASASAGVGKIASAEVAVKVGSVELKDGKTEVTMAKVETAVNGTSGGEKGSVTSTASPESVTIGAKVGAFGATISADLGKAADAVGSFFSAIGNYFKSAGNEANSSFFGTHGKPQ
jgi:RHS repeat-associated protein